MEVHDQCKHGPNKALTKYENISGANFSNKWLSPVVILIMEKDIIININTELKFVTGVKIFPQITHIGPMLSRSINA